MLKCMLKYTLINNYIGMRVLLLSLFFLLATNMYAQETRSVQIAISPLTDSIRVEFDDVEYYTNKRNTITVNTSIGQHDLYLLLPDGLIVYTLDITNKTSIIVIEL